MQAKTKNQGVKFCYYAVAFIDILGQKERLQQLTDLPKMGEDREKFLNSLKKTYGYVAMTRQDIMSFFESSVTSIENDSIWEKHSPETKKSVMKWRTSKPRFAHISDTIIMYTPLVNEDFVHNLCTIQSMIYSVSSTMLLSLARGIPLRGGIEIGLAGDFPDIGLYGPAIYETHDLENRVAQYPRIVVGESLIDLLDKWERGDEELARNVGDVLTALNIRFATVIKSFLCEDVDGRPILNFMGSEMRKEVAKSGTPMEIAQNGFDFVIRECERFKKEKNEKLAFRYTLLADYISSHLPNWCENDIHKPEGT